MNFLLQLFKVKLKKVD